MFDHKAVKHRLMDDDALVNKIVTAYLKDMVIQIEQLHKMADEGNTQQAGALAHKIKGASANVGGMKLSAQALKIELAGKAGNMDVINTELPGLSSRFSELKAQMEDTLQIDG